MCCARSAATASSAAQTHPLRATDAPSAAAQVRWPYCVRYQPRWRTPPALVADRRPTTPSRTTPPSMRAPRAVIAHRPAPDVKTTCVPCTARAAPPLTVGAACLPTVKLARPACPFRSEPKYLWLRSRPRDRDHSGRSHAPTCRLRHLACGRTNRFTGAAQRHWTKDEPMCAPRPVQPLVRRREETGPSPPATDREPFSHALRRRVDGRATRTEMSRPYR